MKRKLACCVILLAGVLLQAIPVVAATGTTEVSGTVPLVTYDISVSDITTHRATISWKTNGDATSQIFYDTQFHDDIADYDYHTDEDATLVSEHSIRLTGLSSDTRYHFRVRSVATVDSTEFIAISEDYTFRTGAPALGPTRYYLKANLFGEISKWRISSSGRLLETVDITSKDGKIDIYIPRGTYCLDEEGDRLKKLIIEVAEETPEMPGGYFLLGNAYDFSPDGATFDAPIELLINYDPEELPEKVSSLFIAAYDEEQGWRQLAPISGFVAVVGTATAEVSHFTTFAVIATVKPPAPAAFTVSKLIISPTEVDIGQSVTSSVIVTNTSGETGSYKVTFKIDGVLEATREVTLSAGATFLLTFTTAKDVAGSYSVDVNGLSGSFTVKEKPALPPTPTPTPPSVPTKLFNWPLVGGIIAGVAAVGLGIFFWIRRRAERVNDY